MIAAVIVQLVFTITFTAILTPFRFPLRQSVKVVGWMTAGLCVFTVWASVSFGTFFLVNYGFIIIGPILFFTLFFLSEIKGFRFLFIVLTVFLIHQMMYMLLMVFRIYAGGFTPLYFLLNFISFGLVLAGGLRLRGDFHKIMFTYKHDFTCLCAILFLLFLFSFLFSPVVGEDTVDYDMLYITLAIDLLVLFVYLYIAVSFRSLGKYCDAVRDSLSLQFQLEEATSHLKLLQVDQEKTIMHHRNLKHHFQLLRKMGEKGDWEQLKNYLDKVLAELEQKPEDSDCYNEAASLLIASFLKKARASGVELIADARIPGSLPISNTELCTILLSALENAITAAENVTGDVDKTIYLIIRMSEGKLLIRVTNPYSGVVEIKNNLPRSNRSGQGFGVKGIQAIVEQHGGLYSFDAKDGTFMLRIAI